MLEEKGDPAEDIAKAIDVFLEKLEVVKQMFSEKTNNFTELMAAEPESYFENTIKFNYDRFSKVDSRGKALHYFTSGRTYSGLARWQSPVYSRSEFTKSGAFHLHLKR